MSTIYVLLKNGQQVAHDESHIHDLLRQGFLTRETLFWREGMPEWRPLQELFPGIAPAAPTGRAGDSSQELPAPAPSEDQPSPSTAPSAQLSDDDDDDDDGPRHTFRFMHKVRFSRLQAASFDLFMVLVPIIIKYLFGWFMLSPDETDDADYWFFFGVGIYYLGLIIIQVMQTFGGRSLGKSYFGLRVVDIDTRTRRGLVSNAVRLATHGFFTVVPFCVICQMSPHVLEGAILYALIDVLPIFYDDRCLHDYLAGTKVIQRSLY